MGSIIALTIFVVVAIALIVIVLLQQSKGAGMGASFGSGASGTVFGSKGAGSFLYKLTCVLALVFFVSSLAIVYYQNKSEQGISIYQQADNQSAIPTTVNEVPAVPVNSSEIPTSTGSKTDGNQQPSSDIPTN